MSRHPGPLPTLILTGGLLAGALAGCGGSTSDGEPAASSAPSASAQPTGSPFTATLAGPETAEAGQTITVTVTNTGRLPNQFQLDFVPASAATSTPQSVSIAAGESAAIQVQVTTSPFNINLEASRPGLGDFLDTLEVGSTS